jgi:hypothetical protein
MSPIMNGIVHHVVAFGVFGTFCVDIHASPIRVDSAAAASRHGCPLPKADSRAKHANAYADDALSK